MTNKRQVCGCSPLGPFFYLVAVNNVASVQNLTTPHGAYVSLPPQQICRAHQNHVPCLCINFSRLICRAWCNLTKIKCQTSPSPNGVTYILAKKNVARYDDDDDDDGKDDKDEEENYWSWWGNGSQLHKPVVIIIFEVNFFLILGILLFSYMLRAAYSSRSINPLANDDRRQNPWDFQSKQM